MVRTVIFGLGNVAERIHIPACREISDIDLIAASETQKERAHEMKERFHLPAVYDSCQALLERERPDLVIIGTPPDSHAELCLLALRSGADVLCEKPFARTLLEADEVIAEAERRNLLLAVNTQYRFMPIYRVTRERLAGGEFGRLYFIQCWQQMFHPPAVESLEWRRRLRQSTLYEFAPHALDLICHFFDALPTAVSAEVPRVRAEFDSDVLVQMTLRFADERVATIALNRVSHAPERYLEMRLDCDHASLRVSLGGVARAGVEIVRHRNRRRFNARLSFVKGGEARVESDARSRTLVREPRAAFASATAAHLRMLLSERENRSANLRASAEHAREILRVVLAGYESAKTGRTVDL
jgi:predicted dehydrogenase